MKKDFPTVPSEGLIRHIAPDIIYYPYQQDISDDGGSNHFHWTIQAFQKLTDDGTMEGVATVVVEATTEEKAISRAQTILVRNYYRVMHVAESCTLDEVLKYG